MHYFKRNIGDYHKKAGRLTMLQHGAYTLLIDACYDRERFPTMDDAIDWCWASTEAEIEAVKFVLSKFFTATDSGEYVQNRIQEEIDNYHKTAETNKRIAIERETKRREKGTKRAQGVNEAPPNQEPLTTNHKPRTSTQEPAKEKPAPRVLDFSCWPNPPSKEILADWKKIRQAKKAPLTQTAISRMAPQIKLATDKGYSVDDCIGVAVEKGWTGFKAEWMDNYQRPQGEGVEWTYDHARKIGAGMNLHPGGTENDRDYIKRIKEATQ